MRSGRVRYSVRHVAVAIAVFGVLLTTLCEADETAQPATPDAASGSPGVEEIVRRAYRVAYYQGRDGSAQVDMEILDKEGRKRTRTFAILRRDQGGEDDSDETFVGAQKFFVYFKRPADWNKTVFMVHKYTDRDDDRWLYLPGLDLVKRIAATDRRTSFVGSHFFYEDVSGRGLDEDVHEMVEETADSYVVKSTPKHPAAVEFAHYVTYIHKATFLPYAAEYFDQNGEKYRAGRALATEVIDGYLTPVKSEMADLQTGGKTVMTYSKVKYDIDLPETIFTEQYLRNAPRRYLR